MEYLTFLKIMLISPESGFGQLVHVFYVNGWNFYLIEGA